MKKKSLQTRKGFYFFSSLEMIVVVLERLFQNLCIPSDFLFLSCVSFPHVCKQLA